MQRWRKRLVALLALAMLLSACGGVSLPGTGGRSDPPAQVDARLIQGGDRFAFDLLHALLAERPSENLFISPASVSLALAMTNNGARGETEQAIARALSLHGLNRTEVNQANEALQALLSNPDPKVQLHIANSIWYQQGLKVDPAFMKAVQEHYKAEVQAAEFGKPAAAQAINRWASKATRERIPQVVQETRPDHRMFLLNAIYFKGDWQTPFDAKATRPQPFTRLDGSRFDHPMMSRSGKYRYLKGDNFQAAALPYGSGRLAMYLVVPDQGVDFAQFVSGLTADRWAQAVAQMRQREGTVSLPKVKLEYKARLNDSLSKLGMGLAFGDGADFSGLFADSAERLAIDFVDHLTFLEMNEQGTEAAAVTVVGVVATSAPVQEERFDLRADRPYLILIRDDQTGALLFVGAIVEPK